MANGCVGSFRSDKFVLSGEDAQLVTKGECSVGISPMGLGFLFKIGGNRKGGDGPETKQTVKGDLSMS